MEKDPNIPPEEKSKHMQTWWEENLRTYSKQALKKEDYLKIVLESRLLFRNGVHELLRTTSDLQMPMHVVSGGITEIIEACFCTIIENQEVEEDAAKAFWESINIFSNSFEYDDDRTVGYK